MRYRRLRVPRPPILFELQLLAGLAHLSAEGNCRFPPPRLWLKMRDYVESMLLAEKVPPKVHTISMLLENFSQLVDLSNSGKPFIYRKRNSVSLLFDVCAVQSEMLLESPDELVLGYTHTMMGFLLFSAEPKRIAMIGLGGGSMPKYCYHRLPQASVVVAENDPNVIALRVHFRVPENDARFEVRCEDGAQLVRRASDAFDVLIVDGFDREGQPAQLCSQRFYDDCHGALASDGIMVVNLLGDAAETEIYLDRIRLSFDGAVIVVPDADGSNRIVFACKGRLLDIPEQRLLGRLRQLESQHPLMLRRTVKSILHQRRTAASRA